MSTSGPPQGSTAALREANSRRVIDAIHKYGGITQVELAAATGLSAATVSNIVKQLQAQGVVETKTTIRSGRRAQLVTIAHATGLVIGVHVGHRNVVTALGDTAGGIIQEQALPLPAEHRSDTTLDRVALLAVEMIENHGATLEDISGVGVAIAASVDPESGKISTTSTLRSWGDTPVASVLETRLGTQVSIDNDANLGALAESRFGAARGVNDLIYVRASYGTSAGIMLDGTIHRGRRGRAGELGHVEVDAKGAICTCGSRGCLNTVVGADALTDRLRVARGPMTLRDIVELAREGDPGCSQVIADAGETIGRAVASLALAMDPECIVVGGEMASTGDTLLAPMREVIAKRVLLSQPEPIDVLPSQLGRRAEVTGALALALDQSPFAIGSGIGERVSL